MDHEDALEAIDNLLWILDEIEEIPAAEDFAGSVREGAEDMRQNIEEWCNVTPAQVEAIENWTAGAMRWQRRD